MNQVLEQPKPKLEIDKMLTISSFHISGETSEFLDDESRAELVVYGKATFGWFIVVDHAATEENVPDDLKRVLDLAREKGCAWLCLDQDANILEELPEYNW